MSLGNLVLYLVSRIERSLNLWRRVSVITAISVLTNNRKFKCAFMIAFRTTKFCKGKFLYPYPANHINVMCMCITSVFAIIHWPMGRSENLWEAFTLQTCGHYSWFSYACTCSRCFTVWFDLMRSFEWLDDLTPPRRYAWCRASLPRQTVELWLNASAAGV